MSPFATLLEQKLKLRTHASAQFNPPQSLLIADALQFGQAILTKNGALSVWGAPHATGRIPQDTYTVRHDHDQSVDWAQPNNRAIAPDVFDALFEDALGLLKKKDHLYITDRSVSAETQFALPVRTISDSALTALFTYTMFRPVPGDIGTSDFVDHGFTLLVLPWDHIRTGKYRGILREVNGPPASNGVRAGKTVDHTILMDFERRAAIIFGTSYLGAVKKTLFTAMNHLLPASGVLPLHCAAVEDTHGSTHLFLGLSGTGKTTLSSGPGLTMIGDDEHLWSPNGVANLEYGCYAKLVNLSQQKEPDIYDAVFGEITENDPRPLVENAMTYPDGSVDVHDTRLTENSRAAYVLSRLKTVKTDARGVHPSTIIFLTADAQGILPPVAKLPLPQAMLWFLLGYTSKLAGTETGITAPQSTFSRFFGGAFMPRHSEDYLNLFQKYVSQHRPEMYLINTGWSGGPVGVGKRMDITLTRRLVDAALCGQLKDVPYREDPLFHLLVPRECPGIDPSVLDPRTTWADPQLYDERAKSLAGEFGKKFDALNAGDLLEALRGKCPGR